MDTANLSAIDQLSEDNSNKEKEQVLNKANVIDESIEKSDSSYKGKGSFLERDNAIDEGIDNTDSSIEEKEQFLEKDNPIDKSVDSSESTSKGKEPCLESDNGIDESEENSDSTNKGKEQSLESDNAIDESVENSESTSKGKEPCLESINAIDESEENSDSTNKGKDQCLESDNAIDESVENSDSTNKGKEQCLESDNAIDESVENSDSTNKGKEQCLESDNAIDESVVNSGSLSEITRKETGNISSTAGEEEDAVLDGGDTAKEFDVNLDEDELLKDTDTDDCKNSNSESIQITSDATHLENIDGNSLRSEQIEPIPNIPQCSNNGKDEDQGTCNVLSSTNVCDIDLAGSALSRPTKDLSSKDKNKNVLSTTSDLSTEDKNKNVLSTSDLSTEDKNTNVLSTGDQSKTNTSGFNNDETKFLHVDQDASRADESYETVDTGGEDPFAQTCDEVMEISDETEKVSESGKVDTIQESTTMDVDEVSTDSPDKTSLGEVDKPELSEPVTDKTTKEIIQGEVAGKSNEDHDNCNRSSPISQTKNCDVVDSQSNSNFSNINPPTHQSKEKINVSNNLCTTSSPTLQTEETTGNAHSNDAELPRNSEKDDPNTNSRKKLNDLHSSIVADHKKPDKVSIQEISKVPLISPKPKTYKSYKKTRMGSSEEDSDESDFEISTQTVQRPKRNAAKKAESQIKVVRELEEEVDQQEHDTNTVEEIAENAVEEIPDNADEPEEIQTCHMCKKVKNCKINILSYGQTNYFCDDSCFELFRDGPILKPGESAEIVPSSTVIKEIRSADIQPTERVAFIRKCSQCCSVVKSDNEKTLSWETMDFCSEECLGKYQQELGSHCANCKGKVQPVSLGKYCVRFGYEVKQFCCSSCLEEFKKGLKVCSFCQKDISSGAEGFLAPVGDKGTFKDFCTQRCMEKYEQMSSNQPPPPQTHPCHVCNNVKLVEVEVSFESKVCKLCSDICFTAYKFANKLTVDRCDMCKTYFDKDANGEKFNIFYDEIPHNFCCKTCMNVYILAKRKIVPCNWCKVKKYNFDMIRRVLSTGQVLMMCSLNCMTLYQVSINAVSSRRIKCDMCMSVAQAQYHLTMSDATIRNFCTYPCVMNFQQQYSKSPITLPGSDAPPIPTGGPVPVISSVTSLTNGQSPNTGAKKGSGKLSLMMRLLEPTMCRNKNTQTRPIMHTKSVSCQPHAVSVEVQTEEMKKEPILIPVPVPIYVPCPMAMYSFPFPVPVPFPLPVPVPMFLPTTRNSIKGIMKEIKRIQEKVPTDPFQAEMLMMAEMVATDKKQEETTSESEGDNEPAAESRPTSDVEGDFNTESIETSNTFGEDIMQIALKMATELEEPNSDLETQLTPATILNQPPSENTEVLSEKPNGVEVPKRTSTGETRGRKRSITKSPQKRNASSDTKRKKLNNNSDVAPTQTSYFIGEGGTKAPDADMKLKYTFGVNAWRSWVNQKNVEIEKLSSTNKKLKPLKTDILQLSIDELNFSLTMFVKEVQKPNGTQYAPDTIYYLCLGIQQYLYENGRIDNIFTDPYFESFTDALDEIAKKFAELFNDHNYIVTRLEEEHLWECKQLGAHSPHVLLSTLMFFNTKHFNLTNVDEHMMLSFSHIMKHWKRNTNQSSTTTTTTGGGKAPGSRNVLLRFYPPQAVVDDPKLKKKKVYEQQENEDNPLRCPVKLYEFYMSKCPESVKTRSDVFYLQPERSCVPDSPVWYSTMALSKEPLEKMLNRVKMVKEINMALLAP